MPSIRLGIRFLVIANEARCASKLSDIYANFCGPNEKKWNAECWNGQNEGPFFVPFILSGNHTFYKRHKTPLFVIGEDLGFSFFVKEYMDFCAKMNIQIVNIQTRWSKRPMTSNPYKDIIGKERMLKLEKRCEIIEFYPKN